VISYFLTSCVELFGTVDKITLLVSKPAVFNNVGREKLTLGGSLQFTSYVCRIFWSVKLFKFKASFKFKYILESIL